SGEWWPPGPEFTLTRRRHRALTGWRPSPAHGAALMAATVEITPASEVPTAPANGQAPGDAAAYREIRYEHSRNFPGVLERLGVSLLVSTYQAGKLFAVGARHGELVLSFHNFEKAMGVAVRPDRIAVGTRNQVWYLHGAPDIAQRLEPAGQYDGCFL